MRTRMMCLMAVLCSVAEAQLEKADSLEYVYPTDIVVTAPRMKLALKELPFSASVVEQGTMEELPRAVAMDEPMMFVPGVKVDNQANGSRVHLSVRGQGILTERGIRGIKILLDGIPVNDPTGFAPDFFDVDFSTVDHIEVLRGAAASLYGGSASGGIISILTQNSPTVPLFGDANTAYGSDNFWKGFGQFGGSVNDVNYRVSFSRMMGDGYRDHTHFWGDNVYGRATYTPSQSFSVSPIVGWTKVFHENPEGITLAQYRENPKQANPDAIPFNEYLQTERMTNGLTGLVLITPHHEVQFNGYVKRTLFTEANNHTFTHRTILTPGTSLQYTFSSGEAEDVLRNRLSAGTDLQWQTIDEHRVDNLYGREGDTVRSRERIRQRGVGIFLLDKLGIGRQWNLMLSLRYDRISNELDDLLRNPFDLSGNATFEKMTGRIGVSYEASENMNVYANWGQGFLPPATEELAQNPDHFGGFNTHLTSATSGGVDLGVRGSLRNGFYYDVTGFYLSTQNDFDRYRITDPLRNQETFYRNIGSSRRFGLEVYARYAPLPRLTAQVAYTYSHFRYANSKPIRILMDDPAILKYIVDGNSLPNSPEHQLAIDVQYNVLRELSVGFTTETLSRSYIDGANIEAEAAPAYTLLHARIAYRWQFAGMAGELSVYGKNLADTKYVAFTEPDPGGNSYQPGAGREFFGGIRVHL